MAIETIDVYTLHRKSNLSKIRCADFSEAAAVCLDYHTHNQRKRLVIEGDLEGQFELLWKESTQQILNSRKDMADTVEGGAYCLAMLVIEKMTELKVIKQSQKGTGFDYWMGEKPSLGFQDQVRLEVSGILSGTTGQINQRLKEKMEQTKKSDNLNIPAFVVVVEFSKPIVKIKKR